MGASHRGSNNDGYLTVRIRTRPQGPAASPSGLGPAVLFVPLAVPVAAMFGVLHWFGAKLYRHN